MTTSTNNPIAMSPEHIVRAAVAEQQQALTTAVRRQMFARGAALIAAGLWLALTVDWFFEPSVAWRKLAWLGALAAAGAWFVFSAGPRLWRNFAPREVALAMLRQRPALGDDLLVAVEQLDSPPVEDAATRRFLTMAQERAAAQLVATGPLSLLNTRQLRRGNWLAMGLVALFALVPLLSRDALGVFLRRLALSPEPWPRRTQLELVGFAQQTDGQWLRHVARDDRLRLDVFATTVPGFTPPATVEMQLTTPSGREREAPLTKIGRKAISPETRQEFRYEFEQVHDSLNFWLRGGDARLGPCRLEAVARPALTELAIEVTPPRYLQQPAQRYLASALRELPEGAEVRLSAKVSRRLVEVDARFTPDGQAAASRTAQLAGDGESLSLPLGVLRSSGVVAINFRDELGVTGGEDYTLPLSVQPDQPPSVSLTLADIGRAVTPQARIPLNVKLTDDHGLARSTLSITRGTIGVVRSELWRAATTGAREAAPPAVIDLPTFRSGDTALRQQLEPGETLTLQAFAEDAYNLGAERPPAESSQLELEIVSAEELVSRLGEREIELRQAFEKSLGDLRRVAFGLRALSDKPSPEPAGRFSQLGADTRGVQEDAATIAAAFGRIAAELVNNRIENQELIGRIQTGISEPLASLATRDVAQLATQFETADPPPVAGPLAAETERLVAAFEQILARMQSLETYNEIVRTLRGVISDQRELIDRTQEERRDQARSLLLEE